MKYLGIDLGGTKIAAAVVSGEGEILSRRQVPTPRTGVKAVISAITQAAEQAVRAGGYSMAELGGAGIGAPGIVSPARGEVIYWSNLNFHHVPLVRLLEEELGLPVFLENDANAATLGEYTAGAGKGSASLVSITLGTGIGSGAVLGGKLYAGFNHCGMEIGHMSIQAGGRMCTCGRRGCFEVYASASALVRQAEEEMGRQRDSLLWELAGDAGQVDGVMIFAACDRGDDLANRLLAQYQEHLACGIVNCVNIFQPEVLCVGGGLAGAGERLLDPIREILQREDYARHHEMHTRLVLARLGNDAGLVGAALLPCLASGSA